MSNQFQILNLSSYTLTNDETNVLQLGLTFCPDTNVDRFKVIKDIHLFARRLLYKTIYHKPVNVEHVATSTGLNDLTIREIQALHELMELWEEDGESVDSLINPP